VEVTSTTKKEVEAVVDCLILEQEGPKPTKVQETKAKAEAEKEAIAKELKETKAARELEEKEKAHAKEQARLGKVLGL
jgi:hypothetical protein